MASQLTLSDTEWALVTEVLEREQSTLRNRVRHTRQSTFREALVDRLALVDGMLERPPFTGSELASTRAAL
jgi:hypothetical protein